MADLTDEQRRALRILSRHFDGCAERVLIEQGFSYDQLGLLVFNGLATMKQSVTTDGGREKMVVWMKITPTGWKAIAVSKG
jgi:hypothetical protein